MSEIYLKYLIPLEVPAARPAPAAAAAVLEPPAPAPPPARPASTAVARTPEPRDARPAAAPEPPARTPAEPDALRALPAEWSARLAQLDGLVQKLERTNSSLRQEAEQHQHELETLALRVEELEGRLQHAGSGPRLGLASALLVPILGAGLSAGFHFALYELFLHSGDAGVGLANLAAETLLGFHMATESAPHVYFYWVIVEMLWSSLVIIVSIGLVLRRLRRAQARVAS